MAIVILNFTEKLQEISIPFPPGTRFFIHNFNLNDNNIDYDSCRICINYRRANQTDQMKGSGCTNLSRFNLQNNIVRFIDRDETRFLWEIPIGCSNATMHIDNENTKIALILTLETQD